MFLASNSFAFNAAATDGYAIGVNYIGGTDILTLYKVTNGTPTAILTTSYGWGNFRTVGIRVERSVTGVWEVLIDTNGGFDNLVSQGTVTDTEHTNSDFFGLNFVFTPVGG